MSILESYGYYFKSAFRDHKYLLIFTVVFFIFVWIFAYCMTDIVFTPEELYDFEYLAQETYFSFPDMMDIIINNVYLNCVSYFGSIFFGWGALSYMIINVGLSGVYTRATHLASGDPFLFIKFTCVHGFFEDSSTILNSFAGFILFSFIVRFFKDLIKPSERIHSNALANSWQLNKRHLWESLAIFIFALLVMIFAGFLEEYISIPIGNFIASII